MGIVVRLLVWFVLYVVVGLLFFFSFSCLWLEEVWVRGQRFGLSSECREERATRTLEWVLFLGAGVIAGTEINGGLMMAMVMEAHGHFLESLCV